MCNVKNLARRTCEQSNAAGVKQIGYTCPVEEFAGWPAYSSGTAAGDTVRVTAPFDFTGAPSGKGFWRSFPNTIEKGSYKFTLEGPKASKTILEEYTFQIDGLDAAQLEFVNYLKNGAYVFLAPDNAGTTHVIGRNDSPAFVETSEGNTGSAPGDERMITVTVRGISDKFMVYEGAIDTTPNV